MSARPAPRVGIAGYGVVGKRRHECIQRDGRMRVTGVCDRTFGQEQAPPQSLRSFQTFRQLLEEPLDVLLVCLTNDLAAEATIAGLARGLHVFCEKPPGRTVADVECVLREHTRRPRLKLMYGFNHRYHESVKDALTLVRSGEFGRIINMRGVYGKSRLVTFNQSDWRTRRAIAGGGVLLDQGIHMVDLMRLFAGEFTEVHSFVSNDHWHFDVEDNAYALMRTADGIVGMINSSATQWRHRFHLDINLSGGSVILGGILSGSKSYGAETLTVVRADPATDCGDPREVLTRYNRDPSWDEEIRQFASAIIEDLPIVSGTAMDALATMKLVYRIYYADPAWRAAYGITNPDGS